jgi:hypothetical protein
MEPTAVAFRGVRGDHTRRIDGEDWNLSARVLVEDVFGVETDIPWHLEELHKSSTGPEWGYGGSGPAQLAYCILREFMPRDEAMRLYQQFKAEVIAVLPQDRGWTLTADQVKEWITCSKSPTI